MILLQKHIDPPILFTALSLTYRTLIMYFLIIVPLSYFASVND